MIKLYRGDSLTVLKTMPSASVHCVVTSPPYWGLRDYGVKGQLGLEPTPDAYVERMVAVFREVRRVLRDDGTCWVNMGDSYASGDLGQHRGQCSSNRQKHHGDRIVSLHSGLKPKDLVGIPWRLAFALQADGWYLRSDIIWHKPNPMPESVRDRPTKSHEYLFLLAKAERYYFDAKAIAEPARPCERRVTSKSGSYAQAIARGIKPRGNGKLGSVFRTGDHRNIRSVWTIPVKPYKGAHFATFPPRLVEPCIKAGCPVGGTVLDPFAGSGTTGAVAQELGRDFIGIDLNPKYLTLARKRIKAGACAALTDELTVSA